MDDDGNSALADAARAGIDLDLIESNLRLTVEERWRQHEAALNLVLQLEEAAKQARKDSSAR